MKARLTPTRGATDIRALPSSFAGSTDGPFLPQGTTDALIRRMFPEPHEFEGDVAGWVKEHGGHLWSKQVEFTRSIHEHRYTAVQSCHDAGKSFGVATAIAHWLETHDPAEVFVVWTAPTWKQVSAIIGRELRSLCKKWDLSFRVTMDCEVYIGDRLVGYGRSVADHDEHGFQGIHAKYILVVVDEACGVSPVVWHAVDALLTNDNARCIAIGNPDDPAAHFRKICKKDSGWNRIRIDGYKTPNFTGERVPEWLSELLLGKKWVRERIKRWGKNSSLFTSKVRGVFPKVSADTLISPHSILRAQERELPGLDLGRFGLDVARFGTDYSVMYWNRGGVIRRVMRHSKLNTRQTASEVAKILTDEDVMDVPVVVDVIGVGAGVLDHLGTDGWDVIAFNAAAQAVEAHRFVNARAEAYWMLKEAMEEGLIDLDPNDDLLEAQLSQLKYKIVNGRIQIEDKAAMKKRMEGGSPDEADAAVMSWYMYESTWSHESEPDTSARKTVKGYTDGVLKRRF